MPLTLPEFTSSSQTNLQRYLLPPTTRDDLRALMKSTDGLKHALHLPLSFLHSPLSPSQIQLRETFEQQRQYLIDDAKVFWAKPPQPERPIIELSQLTGNSVTERLGQLPQYYQGVILGEAPASRWSKQLLLDGLPQFKQQGVTTLYLSYLLSDLHQADLDNYFNQPQSPLAPALKAWLEEQDRHYPTAPKGRYGLLNLVKKARASGIRVVALQGIASEYPGSLDATLSHHALQNYFACQVIQAEQARADAGRWLALMPERQISAFNGVGGVAELTGSIAIRVQHEDHLPGTNPPLQLEIDRGELIEEKQDRHDTHRRLHDRLQADWVIGDRPLITEQTLATRLKNAGDYVMLSQPQRAGYQLRHRDQGGQIIITPIERDWYSRSFYLTRNEPGWQAIYQRRFQHIALLCQALSAPAYGLHLRNAWGSVTPILPEADLPATAVAPLTATPSPQEEPMPAGDEPVYRRYEVSSAMADHLQALQQGRGSYNWTRGYYNPLLEDEATTVSAFYKLQQQLAQDAKAYFDSQPAIPPRPVLPELKPDATLAQMLPSLLAAAPGLLVGEWHSDSYSKRILIELMPTLYQHGVRTLYLEHVFSDVHQADLDRYLADRNGIMPEPLRLHLKHLDAGQFLTLPKNDYSFTGLVKTAHQTGMRIVAIDCMASYHHRTQEDSSLFTSERPEFRISAMNYYAYRLMETMQARLGGAKWVAFVGNRHLMNVGTILGLAELTGGIGIRVSHSPRFLARDDGETYSDLATRKSVRLKTDLRLCNHPVLEEALLNKPLDQSGKFFILWQPSSQQYELRYYSKQKKKIVKIAIEQNTQGRWQLDLPKELQKIRLEDHYGSIEEISDALKRELGMQNVWGDATPQLPESDVPETSPQVPDAPERQTVDAERFVRLRQALLIQLALFANDDQRSQFKTGQQGAQATLAALDLAESDLAGLKHYWQQHDGELNFTQKGALLQAIETRQHDQLDTQQASWKAQLETLGATGLRPLQQNRYQIAAQRLQGVCGALASQLAAAWLLDQQTTQTPGNSHLDHYLQRLNAASAPPETDNARLLGLGLSQWSFIDASEKFGNQAAQNNLTLADMQLRLMQTHGLPQAFELSQGTHALVVGISQQAGQRHYFLADPNFGCAEFPTAARLAQAIQHSLQALSPNTEMPATRFSLRPYRRDLPTRKLFVTKRLGWRSNPRWQALNLADLSDASDLSERFNQGQPLEHDVFFNQQQRRLSLKEYRAALLIPGDRQAGTPTNELLRALLARHHATEAAQAPDARLLAISFQGKNAQVLMQCTPTLNAPAIEIDGERYPDDVAFLQRYQRFIKTLSQSGRFSRLFRARASFSLQTPYLAAALPDDGAWPSRVLEAMQHSAEQAEQRAPIEFAQHDELAWQWARERQQALGMAERFARVTASLLSDEPNPTRWIPILESAAEAPDGRVQLEFRDRFDPEQHKVLSSEDRTPLALKDYLTQKNQAIAKLNTLEPESLPGEDAVVDGLNSAFALQILMRKLTHGSQRVSTTQAAMNKNLALALEIQDYLNSGQIIQGVAQDLNQIVRLVKIALNAEASGTLLASSSALLGKLGGVLQLVSVGLDIYALTQAHTESQRVMLGTRLAFDSAGLGLVGASLLGLEMAGPAGILLAGIGIGLSALIGDYVAIGERAGREVGGYFVALKNAYQQAGGIANAYELDQQHQALKPRYPAIVDTLDLKQNQLTLTSPRLYPSRHGQTGSGKINYFFWSGDMPVMQADPARAIDVCQRLGYALQGRLPSDDACYSIVLPATPQHYIGYRYQTLPGATTRQDAGFDSLRQLEQQYDFDFDFYIFPSEWLIDQLTFSYVETPVKILLGAVNRRLLMPILPEVMQGYLHYQLESEGGQCVISLMPGARLTLSGLAASQTEWVLDARQLTGDTLIFKSSGLSIEGIEIQLQPTQAQLMLIARDGTISSLNLADKTQTVLAMDASRWPASQDGLRDALSQLGQQHKLGNHFVQIRNYRLPADTGQSAQTIDQAWFDVARQRLLYLEPGHYPHAELALVTEHQVFFYNQMRTKVLRVDPDSHQPLARFALRAEQKLQLWQEGQTVMLAPHDPRSHPSAVFAIVNDQLMLVRAQASDRLMTELNQQARLNDCASRLHDLLEDNISMMQDQVAQHDAILPANQWIIIDHTQAGQLKQRVWLRTHDGALLKPVFQAPQGSGVQHPLAHDLALVHSAVQYDGQEVFTFYSAQTQQLYQQIGWGQASYQPDQVSARRAGLSGVRHLSRIDGQLYANFDQGIVRQLDSEGHWHVSALNKHWFQRQQANWQRALATLSPKHTLSLLDWRNTEGQALAAWSHEGRLILAEPTLMSPRTQWLGLDTNGQSAWLYAPESGIVYQQAPCQQVTLQISAQGELAALAQIPAPSPRLSVAGLHLEGDTLSLELLDGVLPPPIQGIRQLWLAPCQMLERLIISTDNWTDYPLMTLDLSRVTLPTPSKTDAPSTQKLQLDIELAQPWGLEISREGDNLWLFDALTGRRLCVLDAFSASFAAKADVTLQLAAEGILTLAQLSAALSADRAELWHKLAEPYPDKH